MRCEICGTNAEMTTKRFSGELFLDGCYHDDVCMLCSAVSKLCFNKESNKGVLTGLTSRKCDLVDYGFSEEESKIAIDKIDEITHKKLVTKVGRIMVLTTIVLPTQSWPNSNCVILSNDI